MNGLYTQAAVYMVVHTAHTVHWEQLIARIIELALKVSEHQLIEMSLTLCCCCYISTLSQM